ncbi:hypothetical protein [Actinokineospora iranica]|uniref:Uncharacterized protein n=1 Tax=Actinokineospora iranica TaxID=1271860 RepID=A0A1G6P3C8_9PSEU|nr:hypothetical protein [Actinokineospora iranica]SDC73927.1 hypothetical protein SAMN05216174_10467 [Actinokineospora iranica]
MNAGGLRGIRAVIVAADSTVGLVAQSIDDLAAHLPPQHAPRMCPLCSTERWPCVRFRDAAHHVRAAGIDIGELVPRDLHRHLQPPQPSPQAHQTALPPP